MYIWDTVCCVMVCSTKTKIIPVLVVLFLEQNFVVATSQPMCNFFRTIFYNYFATSAITETNLCNEAKKKKKENQSMLTAK